MIFKFDQQFLAFNFIVIEFKTNTHKFDFYVAKQTACRLNLCSNEIHADTTRHFNGQDTQNIISINRQIFGCSMSQKALKTICGICNWVQGTQHHGTTVQ